MDLWSIWGVHQPWVYVHSSICEMYWMYWCSIDLWLIGGWSICNRYMWIQLYAKPIGCNGVPWIYGQLKGVHQPWVYVHSSICEMYWVYWCSIDLWSIGGWSICHGICAFCYIMKLIGCNSVAWIYGQFGGSICHGYMCILLYVKLLGCNSVCMDLCSIGAVWVYVHSALSWDFLGVMV